MLGVPVNPPFAMLKVAQAGLFCTEKDRLLPSASLAMGVNEYGEPATIEVGGDPEITGAESVDEATAASPPPPQPARLVASNKVSAAATCARAEIVHSRTG